MTSAPEIETFTLFGFSFQHPMAISVLPNGITPLIHIKLAATTIIFKLVLKLYLFSLTLTVFGFLWPFIMHDDFLGSFKY